MLVVKKHVKTNRHVSIEVYRAKIKLQSNQSSTRPFSKNVPCCAALIENNVISIVMWLFAIQVAFEITLV